MCYVYIYICTSTLICMYMYKYSQWCCVSLLCLMHLTFLIMHNSYIDVCHEKCVRVSVKDRIISLTLSLSLSLCLYLSVSLSLSLYTHQQTQGSSSPLPPLCTTGQPESEGVEACLLVDGVVLADRISDIIQSWLKHIYSEAILINAPQSKSMLFLDVRCFLYLQTPKQRGPAQLN